MVMLCSGSAQAQLPDFDFYLVPHRGDTIREGIKVIYLHYGRYGHVAWVRYEDGTKRRYASKDLKAFSFAKNHGSFFGRQFGFTYHQVESLTFVDSTKKIRTPHFYERIHTCNGHTLYRDFGYDDEEIFRYLVASGNIMKYELPRRTPAVRTSIQKLMPDCAREIEFRLWPKWASRYYRKHAPPKP